MPGLFSHMLLYLVIFFSSACHATHCHALRCYEQKVSLLCQQPGLSLLHDFSFHGLEQGNHLTHLSQGDQGPRGHKGSAFFLSQSEISYKGIQGKTPVGYNIKYNTTSKNVDIKWYQHIQMGFWVRQGTALSDSPALKKAVRWAATLGLLHLPLGPQRPNEDGMTNVGKTMPFFYHPWLGMLYTTYFWWFGGWFMMISWIIPFTPLWCRPWWFDVWIVLIYCHNGMPHGSQPWHLWTYPGWNNHNWI